MSRLEGGDQYMKDRKIYYTGEMKRQRSNDATGKMSFNQRQELADYYNHMKPLDAKIPGHVNKAPKMLYTAGIDHFEGYS